MWFKKKLHPFPISNPQLLVVISCFFLFHFFLSLCRFSTYWDHTTHQPMSDGLLLMQLMKQERDEQRRLEQERMIQEREAMERMELERQATRRKQLITAVVVIVIIAAVIIVAVVLSNSSANNGTSSGTGTGTGTRTNTGSGTSSSTKTGTTSSTNVTARKYSWAEAGEIKASVFPYNEYLVPLCQLTLSYSTNTCVGQVNWDPVRVDEVKFLSSDPQFSSLVSSTPTSSGYILINQPGTYVFSIHSVSRLLCPSTPFQIRFRNAFTNLATPPLPTFTSTRTATGTRTQSATETAATSAQSTGTQSFTRTISFTETGTMTRTVISTTNFTGTATSSFTQTGTFTRTASGTNTETATGTLSSTRTATTTTTGPGTGTSITSFELTKPFTAQFATSSTAPDVTSTDLMFIQCTQAPVVLDIQTSGGIMACVMNVQFYNLPWSDDTTVIQSLSQHLSSLQRSVQDSSWRQWKPQARRPVQRYHFPQPSKWALYQGRYIDPELVVDGYE